MKTYRAEDARMLRCACCGSTTTFFGGCDRCPEGLSVQVKQWSRLAAVAERRGSKALAASNRLQAERARRKLDRLQSEEDEQS